jgi:Arc/MetJ-type ribon-helix-helix transcriptional regulator
MPKSGFRTISIPQSYYEKIEEYINHSNGFYVSVAEVVREALREYFKPNDQPTRSV